jgi:hypothetical protein
MPVANKLVFISYLYTVFLVLTLAHPNLIQQTQANDSSYVPKSKRHYFTIWAHLMIAWFGATWDTLSTKVDSMQIACRNKRKIRKSKRVAEIMQLPPERKSKGRACLVHCALNMQANSANAHQNSIAFHTDSGPVGIDNRCAACTSHQIEDFEGHLSDSNRSIKGFGGTRTTNVKMGTIKWK